MIVKKRVLINSIICLFVLVTVIGCGNIDGKTKVGTTDSKQENTEEIITEETVDEIGEEAAEVVVEEAEPEFEEYEIGLMAVGDNLMHMGVVNTGRMEDGSYDYSFLFDGISDFLGASDIKVINQETILGGNDLGFSGYPNFNSPTEVGDSIAEAGFNVVLHASNHSADKGIKGLLNCVSFWKTYPDILMVGIHEEAAESHEIPVLTIKDIDFAILNYTYGPNLETMPSSIRGHLDMLCDWNKENGRIDFTKLHPQVIDDIQRAEEIADVTLIFPHWGTEYTTTPSTYQEEFALQMAEAGADLIIGTHPHVVQPVEWVESENGNRALCFYSLGNYVSTQQGALSMLEAMAWVRFLVTEDGVAILEEKTGVLPMVCHYNSGPTRIEDIYLLEDYSQEMADKHGIRNNAGVKLEMEDLENWSQETFGQWIISAGEALENSVTE